MNPLATPAGEAWRKGSPTQRISYGVGLPVGNSLQEMLHPICVDEFLVSYWEQCPLVISRTMPDYYSGLFSKAALDSLIWRTNPQWGAVQISNHMRGEGWVDVTQMSPTASVLRKAYDQGDTIVLNDLQSCWEPTARLARALEAELSFPANVNVYLTPPGAQGLAPHYDAQDVFILQIEGAKHWRVYPPFFLLPMEEDYQEVPPEYHRTPSLDLTLHAGDLLYLPRGFVHEAIATDAASMHLTVSVTVTRWANLLSSAISDALLRLCASDVVMRQSIPAGWHYDDSIVPALTEHVRELLGRIAGNIDLQGALDQLSGRLLGRMRPLPGDHFANLQDNDAINIETEVERVAGMPSRVLVANGAAGIQFPGGSITYPYPIAEIFRFISERKIFTIRDIPDLIGDASKLMLIRRLVADGLLKIHYD